MIVNLSTANTNVQEATTYHLVDKDAQKLLNAKPTLLKTVETDENAQVEIADDIEKFDTDEEKTVKPKVIGEPREVTTSTTEAQQKTIDKMVEFAMNRYGAKEILDNVMYKDENDNPKSQEIKHKNQDGTYSKTVIEYDKNGKIAKVSVTKHNDESCSRAADGYSVSFTYRDDGTVSAQPNDGWSLDDGTSIDIFTYYPPRIIGQDGKVEHNGFFDSLNQ